MSVTNLTKELENSLATYLGELMCEIEDTHDWIKREELIGKINACNLLLGYPLTKLNNENY